MQKTRVQTGKSALQSACLIVCLSVRPGAKYCPLLEREGGLQLLEPIAEDCRTRFPLVRHLAQQVLRRCRQFRLCVNSESTDELDNLPASVNVDMGHESDSDEMDVGDDDDADSDDDSESDY